MKRCRSAPSLKPISAATRPAKSASVRPPGRPPCPLTNHAEGGPGRIPCRLHHQSLPPPERKLLDSDLLDDADDDLYEDDDPEMDDAIEAVSLEEMLASVEATRKKLAAAGRPVPPVSAWGRKPKVNAFGQRLGKHAKASQPPKKKKKRKKR